MVLLQHGPVALALLMASVFARSEVTLSGILPWVDPDTPSEKQTYVSSRGDTWNLVMSDEFSVANRSFRAGDDHLWTSIEMPDGVNAAMEIYSHNMTTTVCDGDDCYFQIKIIEEETNLTIWNDYLTPPGYQNVTFVRCSSLSVCFHVAATLIMSL